MLLHLWVQDTKQVVALKEAVALSLLRSQGGRASYLDVLDAEQQLYPAEDALAVTQRDQLSAVVTLYQALGGGWKLSDAEWNEPLVFKPPRAGQSVPTPSEQPCGPRPRV